MTGHRDTETQSDFAGWDDGRPTNGSGTGVNGIASTSAANGDDDQSFSVSLCLCGPSSVKVAPEYVN
jgi:hypothetical protein